MKLKALFLSSLLALSACAPADKSSIRASGEGIIGGVDVQANDPIAATTALLIDARAGSLCTTSILSARWLVTAAHCVYGKDPRYLVVGFTPSLEQLVKPENKHLRRFIVNGAVHPQYVKVQNDLIEMVKKAKAEGREFNIRELDNITDWGDIALIELNEDIPAGFRPAELLPQQALLQRDQTVVLAGYGRQGSAQGSPSGFLKKVEVRIDNPTRGKSEVLLNQREGKGACHGDSGGPAYVQVNGRLFLWGVTSHGVGDTPDNQCVNGSAYTNIQAFRGWINQHSGL